MGKQKKIYDIRKIVDVVCPKCGYKFKARERSVEECIECKQAVAVLGFRRPPKDEIDKRLDAKREAPWERKLRLEREELENHGKLKYERNKEETRGSV
jgi:hypothetical protein